MCIKVGFSSQLAFLKTGAKVKVKVEQQHWVSHPCWNYLRPIWWSPLTLNCSVVIYTPMKHLSLNKVVLDVICFGGGLSIRQISVSVPFVNFQQADRHQQTAVPLQHIHLLPLVLWLQMTQRKSLFVLTVTKSSQRTLISSSIFAHTQERNHSSVLFVVELLPRNPMWRNTCPLIRFAVSCFLVLNNANSCPQTHIAEVGFLSICGTRWLGGT